MRCAGLRTEVCDAFAIITVPEEAAHESLPEQGAPKAFVAGALEARAVEHSQPTMLGPATVRNPGAAAAEEMKARPETGEVKPGEREGHCGGTHGAVAGEHRVRVAQHMAGNLNGLEEARVVDPGLALL